MTSANLNDLIAQSSSTRKNFLSLPAKTQQQLHEHGAYIHSAADLHAHAGALEKYHKAVMISESLDHFF